MFYKVIAGLIMSPSLGEEFIAYEKTLAKRHQLQKIAVFLIAILLALNILVIPLSNNNNSSQNSLRSPDIESNKDISLSSTINLKDNDSVIGSSQEVTFRLLSTNNGSESLTLAPNNNISDILEYANITDVGDGTIKGDNIVWPEVTLLPGETYEVFFTAKTLAKTPARGRGVMDKNSYDCHISNIFGNRIDLKIDCPAIKNVDIITTTLPKYDVFLTTITLLAMLLITSTLAYRTNILLKQLSFIRRNREVLYVTK